MNDTIIDEALALLGQSPLPEDAEAKLETLEAQAQDDPRWPDIWEGFVVASTGGGA